MYTYVYIHIHNVYICVGISLSLYIYIYTHKDIVKELGISMGLPSNTVDEQQLIFDELGNMRSFNERGPIVKFSRWYSIHQSWRFYENEWPGLRAVHQMIADKDQGEGSSDLGSSLLGGESAEKAFKTLRANTGTIKLIPRLLNETNFANMRMFVTVTETCWQTWAHRIGAVRTPQDSLEHHADQARGGWQTEISKIAQDTETYRHRPPHPNSTLSYNVDSNICLLVCMLW